MGLEELLNGQSAQLSQGYIKKAIELFRLAHSNYVGEGFAVKDETTTGSVSERFNAHSFVLAAYEKINPDYVSDIKTEETKIREGLYFTECLCTVFARQEIPKNSVDQFRELQQLYSYLHQIAEEEYHMQEVEQDDE